MSDVAATPQDAVAARPSLRTHVTGRTPRKRTPFCVVPGVILGGALVLGSPCEHRWLPRC
jgi:hypothetical protein